MLQSAGREDMSMVLSVEVGVSVRRSRSRFAFLGTATRSSDLGLMSAVVLLLQGSLAPQHTEIYLQLTTEYLKMVPHPLLAAMVTSASTRTWLILQEVLLSLGPEMYWSQRRTLLVIRTMEMQTAWLNTMCLVSLACLVYNCSLHAELIK